MLSQLLFQGLQNLVRTGDVIGCSGHGWLGFRVARYWHTCLRAYRTHQTLYPVTAFAIHLIRNSILPGTDGISREATKEPALSKNGRVLGCRREVPSGLGQRATTMLTRGIRVPALQLTVRRRTYQP